MQRDTFEPRAVHHESGRGTDAAPTSLESGDSCSGGDSVGDLPQRFPNSYHCLVVCSYRAGNDRFPNPSKGWSDLLPAIVGPIFCPAAFSEMDRGAPAQAATI